MSLEAINSITRKIKDTKKQLSFIESTGDPNSIITQFTKDELTRRLEELTKIKSQVLESQAKESVSIRMYGENVEYGKISNRVLISVLGGFQSMLDSIASVSEGSPKGKIKNSAKFISDFKVSGTFAGSFGVTLEKDNMQHEVTQESLKTNQVVSSFFDVLEHSIDSEQLIRRISPYGKRTITHYKDWLKELKNNAVNLEMNWCDESAEVRRLDIKYSKVESIIYTLDGLEVVTNENVIIKGVLTGINIRRNTFELNSENGIIKGTSTPETLIKISQKLGQQIQSEMIVSTIKTDKYIDKKMWYLVDVLDNKENIK